MATRFVLALLLSTTGCAMLSGAPPATVTAACSMNQAWAAALDAMSGLTIDDADKEKGRLTTVWAVMSSGRKAGVFQRDANQERARFLLDFEQGERAVTISVRQAREYFSSMGVQSQSTRWKRVPPLAEDVQRLLDALSAGLKEQGCDILT